MNWETLLCFGDSITFGARSYLGYPELCASILSEKQSKHWNVINHATNGFTTIDLLRSIDKSWMNLKSSQPSLITLMIGTNDIKIDTSIENFTIAFRLLLTKLKLLAVNNQILILNIPPIFSNVFYPYNFSMNEKVTLFNNIIHELCKENKLRTLSLQLTEQDLFDGVHFSEIGSKTAAIQLSNLILADKGL